MEHGIAEHVSGDEVWEGSPYKYRTRLLSHTKSTPSDKLAPFLLTCLCLSPDSRDAGFNAIQLSK
jgi:hypothetical protein